MPDIMQEINAERVQIQSQERDLNIRKIQLAIKELYVAFEDGKTIRNDDVTLQGIADHLNQSVALSQRFPKGIPTDMSYDDD
jgi:hypothetical protein